MLGAMIALVCLLCLVLAPGLSAQVAPAVVPQPRTLERLEGALRLPSPLTVLPGDVSLRAHAVLLGSSWQRLTGEFADVVSDPTTAGALLLSLDRRLGPEQHRLDVTSEQVTIRGGSSVAVAHGTATFLQLVQREGDGWSIPRVRIDDAPANPYRAVMVDIARQPHSLATLRGMVDLAWLYKLRYLQLHLTDDQAFTFPFAPVTDALQPSAPIPSLAEWRQLSRYADARGVTIIPELDLPGHSTQLKRSGYLDDPTPHDAMTDADVAHPVNHDRILRIVEAMLDVFDSSPYFHVGGDESGAGEALVPFLAAVNAHLRSREKPVRLLVWEGFGGAPAELPATGDDRVTVMAWEHWYNPPWNLLDAGYEIINASWKPLYVVGRGGPRHHHIGGRRWSAREIHHWAPDEFWHWQAGSPVFEDKGPGDDHRDDGIWHAPAAQRDQILGGQLLFWEQREWTLLADAWERVSALAERLWSGDRPGADDWVGHTRRRAAVAERVRRLVQPARFVLDGAVADDSPVADDFHWFHGELTVSVDVEPALGGEVRITRDGSEPQPASELYVGPINLSEPADLRARLFVNGGGVGATAVARVDNRPARVRAQWFDVPRRALPNVPDFSDRRRWTPFRTGLLPELRGPYRTHEPVGMQLTGTFVVPEDGGGEHGFRLQTRDGRARLYVDGEPLLGPSDPSEVQLFATVDLEPGPHAVRVDHAGGPISPVLIVALQRPGDPKWRDISGELAEIPRDSEPLELPPAREVVDLFAGNSLGAFDVVAFDGTSTVDDIAQLDDDGVLHIAGDPRGYLVSKRWYRDYRLDLQWRWPEGGQPGNSGVLVHATTPRLFFGWPRALEVQLQHGHAGDFWTIGRDVDVTLEDDANRRKQEVPWNLHSHRRLPRLVDDVERPVGQWNSMSVECRGGDVIVRVNGVEVQRGLDGTLTEGGIALQSEGAAVDFRDVRVSPLLRVSP